MLDETKLFDFVKIMFTKRDSYAKVKESSKKRNNLRNNRLMNKQEREKERVLNLNGIK